MERKFNSQDMANELGNTVAVMAKSAMNLVAAGAYLYAVGVYVDKVKAASVGETLHAACATLGYGKSSKYALAGAAMDVARRLVKDFGQPNGVELNQFWVNLGACATPADAVTTIVNEIAATYGATTVNELYTALKSGGKAPTRTEKTVAEKVEKAIEGASGDELAAVAIGMQSLIKPSDAPRALLNLASKLTVEELNGVLAALTDMVIAKAAPAEEAEKEAA